MHREAAVTLYVKPHIRRFVQRKLADPAAAAYDATARSLWIELERLLDLKVLGVCTDDRDPIAPVWQLSLLTLPGTPASKLDPLAYRRYQVNNALNKAFYADMYHAVHHVHRVQGLTMREGLTRYRDHYGVTEEDHPFSNAERHLRKMRLRSRRRQQHRTESPCR